MTDDARAGAAASAYRGFLFADMRDFASFAERHGNSVAAAMVGRFLEIARRAIERHDGAEIKTEGDAIHAVFPSASSAVLCGLEIVEAAAELNAREPDRPLRLGVGVHAGEAVETAEGYIGTAVNIAARVCAAARPGEVLVTATVKGITQASIPVGFIARGRPRLKGIGESVEVFRVTRDTNARARRAVPRPVVLGAVGMAAIAAVAVAAVAGSLLIPGLGASPAATPAPTAQPVAIGPLPIGPYRSQAFEPPLAFVVPDQGWTANRDQADILGLVRDDEPGGSLFFLRVAEVISNPCVEGGEGSRVGPAAADVIGRLERLGHLQVSERRPAEVGGSTGQRVDVAVADGALAACGGLVGGEVPVFGVGDEVWRASPGERFRVISVDVGDQPLTLVISPGTPTQSIQQQEALFDLAERIVATVEL
jgi:class 3 adenylate cyclase